MRLRHGSGFLAPVGLAAVGLAAVGLAAIPAIAWAAGPPSAPNASDPKILAANRLGMMQYCIEQRQLDVDGNPVADVLKTMRKGSGEAGERVRLQGRDGVVFQNGVLTDITEVSAKLNRPTRWLCDELADSVTKGGALPAALN